jgi:hypothetical protein
VLAALGPRREAKQRSLVRGSPAGGLWPNIVVSGHAPPCEGATDSDPSQQFAEALDRSVHYLISRFTLGLSGVPDFRAVANRPDQRSRQDEVEALTAFITSLRTEPKSQRY